MGMVMLVRRLPAIGLLLLAAACGSGAGWKRPNVPLYVVDMLRADEIGAYGRRSSRRRPSMPWRPRAFSSSAPTRPARGPAPRCRPFSRGSTRATTASAAARGCSRRRSRPWPSASGARATPRGRSSRIPTSARRSGSIRAGTSTSSSTRDAGPAANDAAFGRLLKHLRDRGLDGQTIVAFTADHGEEFWEHGQAFHGKTLFEECVRVPLVVRQPGRIPGPGGDAAGARGARVPARRRGSLTPRARRAQGVAVRVTVRIIAPVRS
jgi:hypothetical protein